MCGEICPTSPRSSVLLKIGCEASMWAPLHGAP
jgi:hypothetical protein